MKGPKRPRAARLTNTRKLAVNLVGLGLWLTGAVWLVFHYFVVHQGDFGPEHSPLEPWFMKAHGAAAFFSLWTGGMLWAVHVVKGWRQHRRRWTGSVMFGALVTLILTGYGLYYVGGDAPRQVISILHWGLGLAAPLAYAAHRLLSRTDEP